MMGKYYTDYSEFLAGYFPGKVQKLSIDANLGCPNRDGTIGRGGCIYCNNQAFSPQWEKKGLSVAAQIQKGKNFFARKYPTMKYLAYFQSYTGTHGNLSYLMSLYEEAMRQEDVVGLIIGTRPDCCPDSLLEELNSLKTRFKREIFLEFGAESSHNITLTAINRCHTWESTVDASLRASEAGFPVGHHYILGLPGENTAMMLQTVERASILPISTIKFHQLQVLRGTTLERLVAENKIVLPEFTPESYANLCARIVKLLPRAIAIERFVAQAPKEMLISPCWGLKNYQFISILEKILATS